MTIAMSLGWGSAWSCTLNWTNPLPLAPAPFASGEPIVRALDDCPGGVQAGWSSGSPCVVLADVHS